MCRDAEGGRPIMISPTGAIPPDHGFGPDNLQCVQNSRGQTIESRKHKPLCVMSKDKDLGLQGRRRAE